MVKIALFGYSGSGKTTLFRYLTGKTEELYDPFKPCIGVGIYKDSNIDRITEIHKARKVVYPEFEFFDFKGFPLTQGFPDNYFAHFFDIDIIVCVINNFSEDASPEEEASSLLMELILYDTEKIQSILHKKEGGTVSISQQQADVLKKGLKVLEDEHLLNEMVDVDKRLIYGIQLLTTRQVLLYINGESKNFNPGTGVPSIIQKEPDALSLYKSIMKALSLITFYTVKGDIVQGWVIPSSYTARQAAGKIHKDIEKGFIKAAVLSLRDFIEIGSWQAAKNTGALKFLGPNSLISDGDIVEFYFH